MKLVVQKSFERDIERLSQQKVATQLLLLIKQLETCQTLSEIKYIKKMKAKGKYYRIRIGDYRLGMKEEHNVLTLLRFMHRKDIYQYFP